MTLMGCSASFTLGQPTIVQAAPPQDNDTVLERLRQAQETRLLVRQLAR
jgi:hypothetical protein